jgi:hypothetical protein
MTTSSSTSEQLRRQSVVPFESIIPPEMTVEQWRSRRRVPCHHLHDTTTRYDRVAKLLSFPRVHRVRHREPPYCGRCNAESLCSAGAVAQRVASRPTTTAHPAANVQSLIARCPASWRRPSEISPKQRSEHESQ